MVKVKNIWSLGGSGFNCPDNPCVHERVHNQALFMSVESINNYLLLLLQGVKHFAKNHERYKDRYGPAPAFKKFTSQSSMMS